LPSRESPPAPASIKGKALADISRTAWAITGIATQGSEFPRWLSCCRLKLADAVAPLVYTAMTRAQRHLISRSTL